MKLTAENVKSIFLDCLFKPEELDENNQPTTEYVVVKMITRNFGFHPQRLDTHVNNIVDMLDQLPDSFKKEQGGGMSFLSAFETKSGVHWGEHKNMEELFALGVAIGRVQELMPRELWSALPGSVPYYVIL